MEFDDEEFSHHAYCPVCQCNVPVYVVGESLIMIHNEVEHSDEDLEALSYGIQ